jgi:hypothetical protein
MLVRLMTQTRVLGRVTTSRLLHRRVRRALALIACASIVTIASSPTLAPAAHVDRSEPHPFIETFDGRPETPQPWHPDNWDVTVHSRDRETFYELEPMDAGHSEHCGAPPASHHLGGSYDDAVFQCNDHVMTAINASAYGAIYLTPNQLIDFTTGEAVVRFDMSTVRTSGRDWIDLWVSPFDDHLQLPLDRWLPDLNGEPQNALHIRMDQFGPQGGPPQTIFRGSIVRNFTVEPIGGNTWTGYESRLTPNATRRDTFELRLSRTHVKFGIPGYQFSWIDIDVADLGWAQGILQLGHHSYTPGKDCPSGSVCAANTWHWDNVQISRALPFTMLHADRRYVDLKTPPGVNFSQPAPENAHLQFVGIGNVIEVSYDGGASWQGVNLQAQIDFHEDHFRSYWTPIPAGTTSVQFRGVGWYGGEWMVRDVSVWALDPAIAAACARCPAQ